MVSLYPSDLCFINNYCIQRIFAWIALQCDSMGSEIVQRKHMSKLINLGPFIDVVVGFLFITDEPVRKHGSFSAA